MAVIKYKDLRTTLNRGGAVFVRQSGSHRVWEFEVDGSPRSYVIPAHNDGSEVSETYIRRLRQLWRLSVAHGVSDEDFFAGNWPAR